MPTKKGKTGKSFAESEHQNPQPLYLPAFPLDDPNSPEIDPEILKEVQAHISLQEAKNALGNCIFKFQLLETTIRDAIAYLINKEDRTLGSIVTTRMSFQKMLDALYALFAHRVSNEDMRLHLQRILKESAQYSERRNALVHSYWFSDPSGVVVRYSIRSSRKKPHKEEKEAVLGELLQREGEFCEMVRELLISLLKQADIFPSAYPDQRKVSVFRSSVQ